MDDGRGQFMRAESMDALKGMIKGHPGHDRFVAREYADTGIFTVGDVVELRGSRFRVKSIKPKELRLKLLPRTNE